MSRACKEARAGFTEKFDDTVQRESFNPSPPRGTGSRTRLPPLLSPAMQFPPLPPELCRFRSFGSPDKRGEDEEGVYALLRGRLKFADISTFNDPFEARPQYVAAFEDAGEQRKAMLEYLIEVSPIQGSMARRRKWAEGLLRGKSMQEIVDTAEVGSRKHGWQDGARILCLMSADAVCTPLPWSHYGDAHRGVCIHFSTKEYPLRFAYPVEYGSEYPKVLVPRTAMDSWDNVRNILLRKCDLWAYEHEYRVLRFLLPGASESNHLYVTWDGDVAIASANIAQAVTLGSRMDHATRTRLINWVKENAPHVEVWQAELHRNRYEIVRKRLA